MDRKHIGTLDSKHHELTLPGGNVWNAFFIPEMKWPFSIFPCAGCGILCAITFWFFAVIFSCHECQLKGERTLSLLVENCGRVNYGKSLDEQRKGIYLSLICTFQCLILALLVCLCRVFLISNHVSGIVGDIMLNDTPLRGFTIHCLDMKQGFIKRSANPVLLPMMITFTYISSSCPIKTFLLS